MVSLPLAGHCNHQDLQPGGAGRKAPPPPTQGAEPVAEIEAELLWEVPLPHPPRGDVPDRRPLPQDHQTGVTGVTGSGLVKVSPCFRLMKSETFEEESMVISPPPLAPPPLTSGITD